MNWKKLYNRFTKLKSKSLLSWKSLKLFRHFSCQHSVSLYEALMEAGQAFGARNVGSYAVECLRVEKGTPVSGYELSSLITPYEAGLESAINYRKVRSIDFSLIYPSIHPSIHPLIHPFTCPSVYLSVCLSICLCLSVCVCLSVCLSFCLSIWLSVCLSISSLSISLFLCLSVYLSVCLSICLSVSVFLFVYLPVHLSVCLSVCVCFHCTQSKPI